MHSCWDGWLQGAEDYTNGVTEDIETVAVKALDATTLEVYLCREFCF